MANWRVYIRVLSCVGRAAWRKPALRFSVLTEGEASVGMTIVFGS